MRRLVLAAGAAAALALAACEQAPDRVSTAAAHCGPAGADSPEHAGMQFVPAGTFTMGSDAAFPEEGPASQRTLEGFWIDRTEVTNAQFAAFVAATNYVTLAERGVRTAAALDAPVVAGSAVFAPDADRLETSPRNAEYWWRFVAGANWRAPEGPGSTLEGREQYPVVHIAYEDALAYAQWHGRSLPTEAQFEFAAQTSSRRDAAGSHTANTWQGLFPTLNDPVDGHAGVAPVACYAPNALGLYDLVGNVWEWTASNYYPSHEFAAAAAYPDGFDPAQPGEAVAVLKGGSFLCAPEYCMRYRPQARIGQSKGLGASHIGFRTVLAP
jgi:formylglycine-generating enzyme required for sulfatase activity